MTTRRLRLSAVTPRVDTARLGDVARATGVYDLLEPVHARAAGRRWHRLGCPVPPPSAVKRATLRSYAQRYGLPTLVETGTYKADTVRALRRCFTEIYSIEVDPVLHRQAQHRCRRQRNAVLLLGDSAHRLVEVVGRMRGPGLFWLDAHYSGGATGMAALETPVLAELRAILSGPVRGHVILIDDYREFVAGRVDYPTEQAVRDLAHSAGYDARAADDILRLVPATPPGPARP
jgi:hypothetical protein